MRKIKFYSLFLLITIFSCSQNKENEEQMDNELSFEIELLTNKLEVDQPISFKLKSNQNIISYNASKNNSNVKQSNQSNYGKTVNLITSFDKIGINIIYLSIQSEKNEILEKEFEIDILKGKSVKIKNIKIISFKNINETWDSEYSTNDINRLADLRFTLEKTYIKTSLFNETSYGNTIWHISEILENQGNLNWDLNNENLNIDPNYKMTFSLGDIDDNNFAQDLLLGPPYSIEFSFLDYLQDKPNKVTLKKDNIDLEIEFELEW